MQKYKKKEETLTKKRRDLQMKGTHKDMEASQCVMFYSLLTEKDICDHQNISVKLHVYVCLSSGALFIFSVRVSSFFPPIFVLSVLQYFPFPHGLIPNFILLYHPTWAFNKILTYKPFKCFSVIKSQGDCQIPDFISKVRHLVH